MKESQMFDLVKRALREYDRVFLVTHLSSKESWVRLCDVLLLPEEENINRRSLFLVEEGIDFPEGIHSVVLSQESAMKLHQLYLTYEFSDCFMAFPDHEQYGTIFHYVDAGIMTAEEAVRAIFM